MGERVEPNWSALDAMDSATPYYDRAGNKISMGTWAKLLEADQDGNWVGKHEENVPLEAYYKIVRRTSVRIEDGIEVVVSTVWLGIDHDWSKLGPPIIFESMVFGGDLDGEQWRYATEEQAIEGHGLLVAKVREAAVRRAESPTDSDPQKKAG